MEINERIKELFRDEPDAPAVFYEDETWTWGDLARVSNGLRHALAAAGVPDGEGVGLVLRQRPHCFGAYLSVFAMRRCAVLVTPIQPDAAIRADLTALRPAVLVADVDDWQRPGFREALHTTGTLGIELTADRQQPVRVVPGLERVGSGPHYEPVADSAVTILTSGTTGPPKRVPVAYRFFASERPVKPRPPGQRGVAISAVPLVSLGGVLGAAAAAWRGRPTVLMERFDIWRWAETVRKYKPRQLAAPPAVLRMLLDNEVPREYLVSASVFRAASAALDPATADEFEAAYGIPVITAYGATEFLGPVTGFVGDDLALVKEKRGSVGRALPDTGVRIVDPDTGGELPRGEVGLLEADPPRRPADALKGWIRTNDLARMDGDGFVWIEGRADDVLVRGGFKVPANAVGEALRLHPGVADAVVVGLPDDRLGQVPAAAVVMREHASVSADELKAWVAEREPGYCVPVRVAFVDALPRNAMFKILVNEVRALIESEAGSAKQ
ncbi:MAG: fatty acid--CoA ligase family protein [Gammaproteobacteria bacterium]|nr:fatty acid--CoA ligase family protein [Gammaproteobacteria bacterium]